MLEVLYVPRSDELSRAIDGCSKRPCEVEIDGRKWKISDTKGVLLPPRIPDVVRMPVNRDPNGPIVMSVVSDVKVERREPIHAIVDAPLVSLTSSDPPCPSVASCSNTVVMSGGKVLTAGYHVYYEDAIMRRKAHGTARDPGNAVDNAAGSFEVLRKRLPTFGTRVTVQQKIELMYMIVGWTEVQFDGKMLLGIEKVGTATMALGSTESYVAPDASVNLYYVNHVDAVTDLLFAAYELRAKQPVVDNVTPR